MTPDDWSLIDRYLAGDAAPAEVRDVEAWLAADPARRAWLDALRARASADDEPSWNVDAAWARVARRTTDARRVRPFVRPAPARRGIGRRGTGWRIAAAALLAAGLGVAWRAGTLTRRRSSPAVVTAMREVEAPRGGRMTVRLPEGTEVMLNAGSRLRYAATGFGAGDRDVWLDGEGYFEVRHDVAHPFRVHARGGVAEDLGTRFVVRAYAEVPRVEVMVAEGRVALRGEVAGGDSAVLGAGQLGTLPIGSPPTGGAPTVTAGVRTERYLAWTTGALVLDDVSLAHALPQLERRYDLAITLADPGLGTRRIVARFRDQSAGEVLDALALALGVRYERSGRTVTLRARTAGR